MNLSYEQYTDEGYLNGFRLPLGQMLEKVNADLAANELADYAAMAKTVRGFANIALSLIDEVMTASSEAKTLAATDQTAAQIRRNDATAAMLQVMPICQLVQENYMTYQIHTGQIQPPVMITAADLSPHRTIN